MNVELVKTLMQAFKESELAKFSLKCDDFELKLDKENNANGNVATTIPMATNTLMQPTMPVANFNMMSEMPQVVATSNNEEKVATNQKAIKSPIVGTFYRADSPSAKPFVEVGSYVHKGDVVCIIEAMKLMNEVEAEEEGEVVEILVDNEAMVEYNQPLIILK